MGSRMVWRRDCLKRFGIGGPTSVEGKHGKSWYESFSEYSGLTKSVHEIWL